MSEAEDLVRTIARAIARLAELGVTVTAHVDPPSQVPHLGDPVTQHQVDLRRARLLREAINGYGLSAEDLTWADTGLLVIERYLAEPPVLSDPPPSVRYVSDSDSVGSGDEELT